MVFSPDDRFAAGVFEKKLVIWDAATGQELRTIPLAVPPGAVHDFDFSPDGSKLLLSHEKSIRDFSISIHTDATLRIYDVQTGRQLKFFDLKQTFRKSGCNIGLPFVVSADSTQLISITENCRLGVFDTSSWNLKQEFHDPFKDANIDLALSPDNRLLAVAYQNRLELWDLASAKLIKLYPNPTLKIYPPHRDAELSYIYQVAFSQDGALLGTRFSGETGMAYGSIITLWGVP
jgi:WD40 repeat protein